MSSAVQAPSILIVEDNPAMRALIHSLVEGIGSAIHECGSGERAVELYDQLRPDWVVMDIKLGAMDGIAAMHVIRRSYPAARIIVVTEHRDPEYRRAALDGGATGFLLKEHLLELPALVTGPPAPTDDPGRPT